MKDTNNIFPLLNKNKTYILGCSFGPDSMALFHMLYINHYSFVVAFVNYHKRKEADDEQKQLTEYCEQRNIKIEILSAPKCEEKRNFQEWARELRYSFFQMCLKKYNAEMVLVGHHQDDLLETYLMQNKRRSYVNFYGIKEVSCVNNVNIYRPLLSFSKQELLDYDINNNVPYSIDCSNLTNDYSRNEIRHSIIEHLSKEERLKLIEEINNKNNNRTYFDIENYLDGNSLDIKKIKKLDFNQFQLCLFSYLDWINIHVDLSNYFLLDLLKSINGNKSSFIKKIGNYLFVKEYDELYITKSLNVHDYEYIIEQPQNLVTNEFIISLSEDSTDRNISKDDYPITIRNVRFNDEYEIEGHLIPLRRAFINWKMPPSLRKTWPVILNKNNKIIYVPRYRKSFCDSHKTTFIINISALKS